jgi:hypothetical protein
MATNTSPTMTIGVGTCDQPNRWSRALRTSTASTITAMPTVAIFCTGLVSAVGPERMRRRRISGRRNAQYTLGPNDVTPKTEMKTHACQ